MWVAAAAAVEPAVAAGFVVEIVAEGTVGVGVQTGVGLVAFEPGLMLATLSQMTC